MSGFFSKIEKISVVPKRSTVAIFSFNDANKEAIKPPGHECTKNNPADPDACVFSQVRLSSEEE